MNKVIESIMHGAIDMHAHGYPEVSFDCLQRQTDEDMLNLAKQYGLRGVVLKNHIWPTVSNVYHLKQKVEGIEIFASIALNTSSGGINPWAVESAARQGAKVVWLPTWSAANDFERGGFSRIMRGFLPAGERFGLGESLRVLDDQGQVIEAVKEVIEVVMSYDLALFTGHISPRESIEVAKVARQMGLKKLVFGHPDSRTISASHEDIKMMASLGAYVEFVALGTLPMLQRISPRRIMEIVRELGAERCLLDTDSFHDYSAPEPEMLRMVISALLELGLSKEELEIMVKRIPERLLNLE